MVWAAVVMIIYEIMVKVNTITDPAQIDTNRIFQEIFHRTTITCNRPANQEKAENRRNKPVDNNIDDVVDIVVGFIPVLH